MFASHLLNHPDRPGTRRSARRTRRPLWPSRGYHVHVPVKAIAADLGTRPRRGGRSVDEVYWLMADALIKLEKGLYARRRTT
ncbi:hypothetical protein QJS66_17410 [Kocuria rhizophila]|nr:hypothetical protein QJS66_17410 [Kocuria rhizophila]